METLISILGLTSLAAQQQQELVGLIDEESEKCATAGDLLGAGEWYASRLRYSTEIEANALVSRTLAVWASPSELQFIPADTKELAANLGEFNSADLANALVGIVTRNIPRSIPASIFTDLVFRLAPQIKEAYRVETDRPADLVRQASLELQSQFNLAIGALTLFRQTKCGSARAASVEILKKYRQLKPLLLPKERLILSHTDVLLTGAFRELCLNYEKNEMSKFAPHLDEIRAQAHKIGTANTHVHSVIWHLLVKPLADHVLVLADEAARTSRVAVTPELKLANTAFKVDLSKPFTAFQVSALLVNLGSGDARKIQLETPADLSNIKILSPRVPFDLPTGRDLAVFFELSVENASATLTIPVDWQCLDIVGGKHVFREILKLEQQRAQPDWGYLLENPPYSVNPVRSRDRLFGRDAQMRDLLLNAAGGTSTFIWGQKRVGKTSLLQVFVKELSLKPKTVCLLLRMGELGPMHEGQIAATIAARLILNLPGCSFAAPPESEFGAGLSKLVPFVEQLCSAYQGWRFVITIDEFDDLDPAFYTGERGRLFVKALRSLSEIGMTFLFAGSERMNVIYAKHSLELNKWVSTFVDSIKSRQDCRDLIVTPLENMIDYEPACVDQITAYCKGNPFYMHLVCQALFKHCLGESRTYISVADFSGQRDSLTESLGQTNFAHLWEDNQILEKDENVRQTAENCLVLCCISSCGGAFLSPEENWQQQESLSLSSVERLSLREISMVIDRLRARKVITDPQNDRRLRLTLPIFSDWLQKNAVLRLLPIWRKFASEKAAQSLSAAPDGARIPVILADRFPISEDDLLPISQRLVYCGRQKDVAEIRQWLRQFDDDTRIELAFLLLRRLSEKGYVSDGTREYSIGKMTDAINAHRLEIGSRKWTVARGRKDDLCISYVDSDLKSGASLARELAKRMSPGKAGDAADVSYWLKSRVDADPILVIADDFAGTGSTLEKGIKKWMAEIKESRAVEKLLKEGRLIIATLFAFGDALDVLRNTDVRLKHFTSAVFGSDVKAFDDEASIFDSPAELDFAREVMIQIGRELTPQMPLGFDDQGALVAFHNSVPNNTLPIFWSNGRVNERNWIPLFSRI